MLMGHMDVDDGGQMVEQVGTPRAEDPAGLNPSLAPAIDMPYITDEEKEVEKLHKQQRVRKLNVHNRHNGPSSDVVDEPGKEAAGVDEPGKEAAVDAAADGDVHYEGRVIDMSTNDKQAKPTPPAQIDEPEEEAHISNTSTEAKGQLQLLHKYGYDIHFVEQLKSQKLCNLAYKTQLVWAKIGAYPFWPAQILPSSAVDALEHFKHAKRSKKATIPVMFFGECNYGWVAPSSVLLWEEGLEKGCFLKKNAVLRQGIFEAKMFLDSGEEKQEKKRGRRKKALKNWWCAHPIVIHDPWDPRVPVNKKQQEGDESKKRKAAEPKIDISLPIIDGKIKLTERMKARLFQEYGSDMFTGKNDFPNYVHLKQNSWTVAKPKKMSRKDISVCACYPIPAAGCSPLPARPIHWSTLREIDEDEKKFRRDYNENVSSNLSHDRVIGCGTDCLNRLSFIHCDSRTCPCGKFCSNKPFHQLKIPFMEVFLTETKGWGVRAKEMIPKGQFIVEYVGEVVDQDEMAQRMKRAREQKQEHFYMMEMTPGLVIDARPKGNIARLLNSSCDPNCVTQKWHDAGTGEIRVGIFTKKDVSPGEELVYDYNFEHILSDNSSKYTCQCGAPNCRGSMDTNQRLGASDCGRRIEIWWDGDSCYYPGVIEKYNNVSGKCSILYDDGWKETISLKEHVYRWLEGKPVGNRKQRRRLHPGSTGGMMEETQNANKDICLDTGFGLNETVEPLSQVESKHVQTQVDPALEAPSAVAEPPSAVAEPPSAVAEPPPAVTEANSSLPEDPPTVAEIQTISLEYLLSSEARGNPATGAILQHLLNMLDEATPGVAAIGDGVVMVERVGEGDALSHIATSVFEDLQRIWTSIDGAAHLRLQAEYRSQIMEALAQMNTSPPVEILEPVENPGAEQTAGSLHGNGSGNPQNSPPMSVSSRGRKRQKKIFGNDFEQDIEVAHAKSGGNKDHSPVSPRREKVRQIRTTPLSPGVEAASIIAQMATSKVEPEKGRSRTAHRRSGPTPPSTGLPARTILVAKRLTNSDVTKGRILLPRAAVEANLSFAVGRAHSLVAKDHEGASWEFTLQSWANGIETRRVFVLEHAGDYLRHHQLKIEDVIGISTTLEGEFMVEFNTDEVCAAAESQQAARASGNPSVNTSLPTIMPGSINPLIQKNSGRCTRSIHCNKPAGHPGFCMRTPSTARGKKTTSRGRGRGFPRIGGRGKRPTFTMKQYSSDAHGARYYSREGSEEEEHDDRLHDHDSGPELAEPGSARFRRYSDVSGGEEDVFRRGGILTPRFPNSAQDYFGSSKLETDYTFEGAEDANVNTAQKTSGAGKDFLLPPSTKSLQLPKYPLPPPPEIGPGMPPIFVMAQDNVPQVPPQLRSPLRPSILGRQQQQTGADTQGHGNQSTSNPIPCSPSAAIGKLPNMGLEDIVDGASPHAFQGNDFMRMAAMTGNTANNEFMSILEGSSPTAAKYDTMSNALGTSTTSQARSQPGMPAAPLPLFGAPPPPLGATHGRSSSGSQPKDQGGTKGAKIKPEFDYSSFLENNGK